MATYVNAFGSSSFTDDNISFKEIEDKMKELSDLLIYQLRTQNDKINFITDNVSSNEQNTILINEIRSEQVKLKAEIEEMKKIFVSMNEIKKVNDDVRFQTNFLEQQQQNFLTRIENIEKKNIQTESRFRRLREILRMFGTPLLHVAKNVKFILAALPRHNIFLNFATFDNEAYINYLQQERNYDIDAKFTE